MALTLVNTSYLHGAFAPGGVTGYDALVHSWAGSGATIAAGTTLFVIGKNGATPAESYIRVTVGSTNRCRTIIFLDDGITTYSSDNTNATAWTNNQWRSAAGKFRAASRMSYLDTIAGTENTQNGASMADWTADRIGSLFDGTGAGNTVTSQCERTVWDISLLSDTQVQSLVTALGTLISGRIPHAMNLNEEVVQGTYSQSGTTVTVTATAHGLEAGDEIDIAFSSGAGVAITATVLAGGLTADVFTYTAAQSQTTSGNCAVDRIWNGKLRSYVTLTNRDAASRTNVIDPSQVYAEGGASWSDARIVAQPTVDTYLGWHPTITSFTPDPIVEGASFTITGTGFSPLGNDPTVTINGVAQTVTASSDTSVTCTAVLGTLLYGVDYPLLVTNDFNFFNEDDAVASFDVPAGEAYATIDENPPDNTTPIRVESTGDITTAAQVRYKDLIEDFGGGGQQEIPIANGLVLPDGCFRFANAVVRPIRVSASVNLNDGEGWSAYEVLDFAEAAIDNPVLIGSDELFTVFFRNLYGEVDLSDQIANPETYTWSVFSGTLPAWASFNDTTHIISGIPPEIGSFGTVVFRVEGDTVDQDITVHFDVEDPYTSATGGARAVQARRRRAALAKILAANPSMTIEDCYEGAGVVVIGK